MENLSGHQQSEPTCERCWNARDKKGGYRRGGTDRLSARLSRVGNGLLRTASKAGRGLWHITDQNPCGIGLSHGPECRIKGLHDGRLKDHFHMFHNCAQEWDRMIDVNVQDVPYGIAAMLPGIVARGSGHIISIPSIGALSVVPTAAVYCATKFTVRAISDGLR